MDGGWTKIKSAAKYSGVSERTFRDWLKSDLRHCRLPSGTILIKFEWIDQFLSQFETGGNLIEKVVDEIFQDLERK